MFFSNSAIILHVKDNFEQKLKNFSFFDNNPNYSSRKFYSIHFHNREKDFGEIHFSNSFEYGRMNKINFIRRSELFILFTSTAKHTVLFKKIFKEMIQKDVNIETLKISRERTSLNSLKTKKVDIVQFDEIYGFIGLLNYQNTQYLIKIYNNGLISFSFTSNKELIEEVINTSLNIIKS